MALAVACAHPQSRAPSPAASVWTSTLDSARKLAASSQYGAADTLLAMYALSTQGSAGANEALFWRGVFLLEPANDSGSVRAAAETFDSYLASGASEHRAEATALQRTTRLIDSLSQSRAMDSVPAMHLVVSDDSSKTSAREAETAKTVKTLQDSLNKTTTELERIKKRLSTGKP